MRIAILALLVALIAGCGSGSELVKPTPLGPIKSTLSISPAWTKDISFSLSGPFAVVTPVLTGGRIYIADPEGTITALSVKGGKQIWRHDIKAHISGGLGYGSGLLLGGTSAGEVFALHAEDGSLLWRRQVSSEVLSPPRLESGIAVVRTVDDHVFGLDAQDGEQRWVFKENTPTLTLRGTSAPALTQDKAIVGLADGKLVAVGLFDGRQLWETRIAEPKGRSELEHMVDIDSNPLVIGDAVYTVTYQGSAAAVDVQTGRELWSRDFSSYLGIAARANTLYLVDEDDNIWAMDRDTGATLWKQDKLAHRILTSPRVVGGMLVVGDHEGYVHWLDLDTGRFIGRYRANSEGISVPPFSDGQRVYVLGDDGLMEALRVTGQGAGASTGMK